ncbi:hypothetical protein TrST_g5934 [Triparma strigata]|uniref:Uncharacterized protein n=2 Tax=Triparma strigata TaxID=1606541 RepID=A0A9W7AKZ1_9STRA|nr:hypothetical protein TrST_g5934 [Triparma strigata]
MGLVGLSSAPIIIPTNDEDGSDCEHELIPLTPTSRRHKKSPNKQKPSSFDFNQTEPKPKKMLGPPVRGVVDSLDEVRRDVKELQRQQNMWSTRRSHGVHMVLIVRATEPGTSPCEAAKWLSISLLIIFVQCWVLSTIVDESSYARCVDHDDCHIGEFCAPSPLNQRINPGTCHDCYVTTLPMSRIETEIYWLYVDDPTYWSSAVSHCTSTDTLPLRCDFLVHNRLMLSGGGVLVLLFSAVVALIPTVADLDQAADERAVMSERGLYKKSSSPIHVSTRALLYISHTSRVHFVPLLVVAATVGLLIADSLNSQNFLLNGLAVGFASNIDDLISFLIVSEAERQDVETFRDVVGGCTGFVRGVV